MHFALCKGKLTSWQFVECVEPIQSRIQVLTSYRGSFQAIFTEPRLLGGLLTHPNQIPPKKYPSERETKLNPVQVAGSKYWAEGTTFM